MPHVPVLPLELMVAIATCVVEPRQLCVMRILCRKWQQVISSMWRRLAQPCGAERLNQLLALGSAAPETVSFEQIYREQLAAEGAVQEGGRRPQDADAGEAQAADVTASGFSESDMQEARFRSRADELRRAGPEVHTEESYRLLRITANGSGAASSGAGSSGAASSGAASSGAGSSGAGPSGAGQSGANLLRESTHAFRAARGKGGKGYYAANIPFVDPNPNEVLSADFV